MPWQNVGDINASGALLFIDAEVNAAGDFSAEAVQSICETAIGGDEKRFILQRGEVYLAAKNFASALDVVGARLEDGQIVRPDHQGNDERFDIASPEGLRELFHAAHAYKGIEGPEYDSFVQIGPDTEYDQPKRLNDNPVIYAEGTCLWAIIADRMEIPDLEFAQGKTAVPLPYDDNDHGNWFSL